MNALLQRFLSARTFTGLTSGPKAESFRRKAWIVLGGAALIAGIWAAARLGGGATAPDQAVADAARRHPTQHSTYLAGLQKRFDAVSPERKVAFVDNDQISVRVSLGGEDPAAALSGTIADSAGVKLAARRLAGVFAANAGPESRLLKLEKIAGELGPKGERSLCLVTPAIADLGGKALAAALAGLDPARDAARIALDINADTLRRLVDYGQGALCFDRVSATAADAAALTQLQAAHRRAIFADVYAALSLAAEGNITAAGQLADLRATHSRLKGPELTQLDPGERFTDVWAGVIGYTAPALDQAQTLIGAMGQAKLAALGEQGLLDMADKLAREQALAPAAMLYIHAFHTKSLNMGEAQALTGIHGDANPAVGLLKAYLARTDKARAATLLDQPVIGAPAYTGDPAAELLAAARAGKSPAELVKTLNARRDDLRALLGGKDQLMPGLDAKARQLRDLALDGGKTLRRAAPKPG